MSKNETVASFTAFLEGKAFNVKVTKTEDYSGRSAKTKVYVWGTPDPETLGQCAEMPAYGSDPVLDAAWKAYNKLEVKNMRFFAESAVQGEMSFSRKAGCSCPCSPGFVLKSARHGYNVSYGVHVTTA